MITSDGKTILIKYMLGQAPTLASHIAVGCGPKPLSTLTYDVTNVELDGSTVTITTSATHGFATSDQVSIKDVGPYFDGSYTVASTPSGTTFTYTITNPLTATTGLVATLSSTAATRTITLSGTTANLVVGQTLTKTSGTGALGSGAAIVAINSSTVMTVSVDHATSGSTTFTANAKMNIAVSPVGKASRNYSSKKALDMEMFRIPIESRGYIIENGISKLVFTGKLPQEERYEITELGVYSAGSNPSAGTYGSKNIFNFSTNETWKNYNGSATSAMPIASGSLDTGGNQVISTSTYNVPYKINSDNSVFNDVDRLTRYERCRYLGSNIMVPGNWSSVSGGSLITKYIQYDNFNIDLSQSMPTDELKLAFSVVTSADSLTNPAGNARVDLELIDSNSNTCRFAFTATTTQTTASRYNVITKTISEGVPTGNFSWENITTVKVYAAVLDGSGNPTNAYFVCLDSLRFENKTVDNPLYKLVAYTPITSSTIATTSGTLIKETATVNSIQFKMGVTV